MSRMRDSLSLPFQDDHMKKKILHVPHYDIEDRYFQEGHNQ